MSDETNKLFDLYTLATLSYEKHFKDRVENIEELYPEDWHEKKNYKLKIEIITQAIKENKLISDTSKYQSSIEGVKNLIIKNSNKINF